MTEPATEARPPAKKAAPTGYIVLELATDTVNVSGGQSWHIAAKNVTASSAEQAVKKHANAAMNRPVDETQDITLVAVPARSWRPVKVTAVVTTSVVLEDAK